MAAFVLNAMTVNAAFKSVLSNDIVTEHPELWPGVWYYLVFCIKSEIEAIEAKMRLSQVFFEKTE